MKRSFQLVAVGMVLGFVPVGAALAQQADPFGGDAGGGAAAEVEATPDPFGGAGASVNSHDPFAGGPTPEREPFDFTFPGGTLKEFATLIEQSNNALRIIVPEEFADAPVPDMQFKAVTFSELSELVDSITRRTDSQIMFDHVIGNRWVAQTSFKKEERNLTILPIEGLLLGRTVEDLIAVIEQAFVVADLKKTPQFHLHDETGVLMASLTESEQGIVRQLLTVLAEAAVAKATVGGGAKARPSGMRSEVDKALLEARVVESTRTIESLQALRNEMEEVTRQYREIRAMEEEPARRAEAGQRLEFLNTELRLLEIEMNYIMVMSGLRDELDDAKRMLAPPPSTSTRR